MRKKPAEEERRYYDPAALADAPEHHEYARALGILTWSTWDHGVRPFDQRQRDFLEAFPPEDPVRRLQGGDLRRQPDGSFAQGTREGRLERFVAQDWRPGSLHELLARYGLKAVGGPAPEFRAFTPAPLRETAQERNLKLRVLHGGVDIEPANMDRAKAEYLDRQEKIQAAKEVRQALDRMHEDLKK